MKKILTLAALALSLSAVSVPSRARAGDEQKGPGAAQLKQLLEDSELKFTWNEEKKIGVVRFSDLENSDTKAVLVYVPDKGGYYAKISLTIIDKEEDFKFPVALIREAMETNGQLYLVKISIDPDNGDVDTTIGFDMEGLTAKVFKDYVMHLANTGDGIAKKLKEYLE